MLITERKKNMSSLRELYLSHCDSPLFSEGVVVEVKDAEARVVLQSCGQRCDARMINAILGHVNFFQAAHQLGKNMKSNIHINNNNTLHSAFMQGGSPDCDKTHP